MADSPSGGGEKTEAPTPKRLEDSAKKGDVLQSKELGTALIIIMGTGALALMGPAMVTSMEAMVRRGLIIDARDLAEFDPWDRTIGLLSEIFWSFGLLFGLLTLTAIITPALLGSLGFRMGAMKPQPSKLNPASGMKRMFGTHGLIELAKSLAKVILMGAVGFWLIWTGVPDMIQLGNQDIHTSLAQYGSMFIAAMIALTLCFAVIAGVDVPSQIFQRSKKLKMTKQEVKDEHKQSEGSAELKGAIRRKQQEVMSSGARQAMKDATLVLANPTHFTVALRYRRGFDAVPVVLARGRGAAALAMRELAEASGVPVMQYPELTRAIYFTTREGMPVDERLYMAVATVLAFLFRLDAKMASEMDRPNVDVPGDVRFDAEGNPV